MAVYKPTMCYPFLNGVDTRVARYKDLTEIPFKTLSCKVDTSNKDITGYSIRILTDDNRQVFPLTDLTPKRDRISPISELHLSDLGWSSDDPNAVNSGINGTTFQAPFFQNKYHKLCNSYNAIYYGGTYIADHIILDSNAKPSHVTRALTDMETLANWDLTTPAGETEQVLIYDWINASAEEQRRNNIMLDGERLAKGDIVLVAYAGTASGNSKCGLWIADAIQTESSGSTTIQTVLRRYTSTAVNDQVVILKGTTFHNSDWLCTIATATGSSGSFFYNDTAQWYDSQGTAISLFDCNDTRYKWELTLYQGNYNNTAITAVPPFITYPDVDLEWLDMTVTSGKILGSNCERIQIAGNIPTSGSGLVYDDAVLPEGTTTEPLVLQEKFVELAAQYPSTGIMSGNNRVYVKTYDSTYGHVYPLTSAISDTVVQDAQYCQFFEHSTNPDEILDTDIVNYTFTTALAFTYGAYISGAWSTYSTEAAWLAATSCLERYIVVADLNDYGINEGDLVLLTAQSAAYQNGVYSYYNMSAAGVTRHCLKRAASYSAWSDYIGKIIFSMSGDSNIRNFECLASAGAYTLWNPQETISGSSILRFVQERPIMLFRNLLQDNHTFNLFNVSEVRPTQATPWTWSSSTGTLDGQTISVGDIILFSDGQYATVSNVRKSGTTWTITFAANYGAGAINTNEYAYILNGTSYGKKVVVATTLSSAGGNWSISWDLHTARILHNTTTATFISPWSNVSTDMKLKLLNNTGVYTYTGGTKGNRLNNWITITGVNDTIYCVQHDGICVDVVSGTPIPLQSYSSSDDGVPWSYDIRSFFRKSDENPFYSYETPYVQLYKNGVLYSDLSMVGGSAVYQTIVAGSSPTTHENYQVLTAPGVAQLEDYVVSMYTAQAAITGRYVSLGAKYIQFGQSSWESYRWQLFEGETITGTPIQDTGRKYDKEISVDFYGLANDTTASVKYTALLSVENDFGDTMYCALIMTIAPGHVPSFVEQGGDFSATYDCSTQSNLLTLTNFTPSESQTYSIYRREYEVLRRPGKEISGYYCPIGYYPPGEWPEEIQALWRAKWGKFFTDAEYNTEINPLDKNVGFNYIALNKNNHIYAYDPTAQYEFGETPVLAYKIYRGTWEPVIVKSALTTLRDFNIVNGKSYQYIIYPGDSTELEYGLDTVRQTYANYNGRIWMVDSDDTTQGAVKQGTLETAATTGEPVVTKWGCWSISELIPEQLEVDAPVVSNQYRVDNSNIWLFKYSLETDSVTQNISRTDFTTLGQFPKMGFGETNYASGTVKALLGSEIILASKSKYIERMPSTRVTPQTTNDHSYMLEQWQNFVYSKNPKLLKDISGQSWIVQIVSSSTTPKNFVSNTPQSVSFTWKQVESTDGAIIYGTYESADIATKNAYGATEWTKLYS